MRTFFLLTTMVLVSAGCVAYSQSVPDGRTLSIAGQTESAKIFDLNGKSYVAVEDVARLTHGSLSFNANQVLLTLPSGAAHSSTTGPVTQGFSKSFLQAGIEEMSVIREWRITVVNSIKNNSLLP